MNRNCSFSFTTLAALACLLPVSAAAQTNDSPAQCIVAGRIDADQRWAPRARGLELLDASGKRIISASKQQLASVKSVRVNQRALLASCNGNQTLTSGDSAPGKPSPAPALSAGNAPVPVQTVSYPPLRVGGSLVELQVLAPTDRVITLAR